MKVFIKTWFKHDKSKKIFKILSISILAVLVVAGLLATIDFTRYRLGERSVLFGTMDTYSQSQELKIEDLNVRVLDVTLREYTKPKAPDESRCKGLPHYVSTGDRHFVPEYRKYIASYEACSASLSNDKATYDKQNDHYQTKNEIIVKFNYANISDKLIDLRDYKLRLIANSPLEVYGKSKANCTGIAKNLFLKGYTEERCFAFDIDKGYNGPLVLRVSKDAKEKIINLDFPTKAIEPL